jgi:hypothetical protein
MAYNYNAKQRLELTGDEPQGEVEFSQDPTEICWFGITKTGKGIRVSIGNDVYVGAKVGLDRVLSGEKKGVKLTKLVPKK